MTPMRWFALALGLALALPAAPAQAEWCGLTMEGTSNCGFTTKAQCMAGMGGLGGSCINRGAAQPDKPAGGASRGKENQRKKKPAQ